MVINQIYFLFSKRICPTGDDIIHREVCFRNVKWIALTEGFRLYFVWEKVFIAGTIIAKP